MTITHVARCDQPGCEVAEEAHLHDRVVSARDGSGRHYCREHYPLPVCKGCGARLRPWRSSREDWPGTSLKSGPRTCHKDECKHPLAPTDREALDAARRLLERHGAKDVAWMLG